MPHTPRSSRPDLLFPNSSLFRSIENSIVPHLQRLDERFLRDIHLAELAHALFAFFLLVEQLAFAGDVAAEADGQRRSRPHHQPRQHVARSEEHTSELQSLMRNSYAVFCLKKEKKKTETTKR